MIQYKSFFLILLCFLIPYFLIYKAIFSGNILAWGDAPYYYPENLKELFNIPFTWDIRNSNFGLPQFTTLWLYLPTFIVGLLGVFFTIDSQFLLNLVFYVPSTLLAIVGSWKFTSLYTKDNLARVLGTLLYSFNTYNLLLIDGGQIGVALAYGLFPLTSYTFIKFLQDQSINNFVFSLINLFILTNVDLRVSLVCLLFLILLRLIRYSESFNIAKLKKELKAILVLLLCLTGLNLYWILPFFYGVLSSQVGSPGTIDLKHFNLVNGLFLHHPNFPLNEFGKLLPTPFYFALLPLLAFGGLIFKSDKKFLKLSIFFLLFAFLAKGSNEPFGSIYSWFVGNLPLGFAFRDSSKFFIPLILVISILLSLSFGKISINKYQRVGFWIFIYIYLLFLVHPAITGNLSGSLNNQVDKTSFTNIYQSLRNEENFFRTVWFSEKPPLAFSSWEKPGISAKELINDRPFASMTVGSYDLFGFLHSDQLNEWFNLLGIKYVFFPENQRQKIYSKIQLAERKEFLNFISKISYFATINFSSTFPSYQISGLKMPQIFAQEKVFIILGGEEIYAELFKSKNFKLASQGLIFLEQGTFDPESFFSIKESAANMLFINKDEKDLLYVFLKDKMISTLEANLNEWAKFGSDEYLKWKNGLSEFGINSLDFDYQKGVSYSTIENEKIRFNFEIPKEGEYVLALRYTNSSESAGLSVKVGNIESKLYNQDFNRFHWIKINLALQKPGLLPVEVVNQGGIVALNTLLLTSDQEFNTALKNKDYLMRKFKSYYNEDLEFLETKSPPIFLSYSQVNPTLYQVKIPANTNWLVFTDHYNQNWQIDKIKPLPFYAMVNGFYLGDFQKKDATIELKPQKLISYSLAGSGLSLLMILIALYILRKKMK